MINNIIISDILNFWVSDSPGKSSRTSYQIHEMIANHMIAQAVYDKVLEGLRSGEKFDPDKSIQLIGSFPGVSTETTIEYIKSRSERNHGDFGYGAVNDAPLGFSGKPAIYFFNFIKEESFSQMLEHSQSPFYKVDLGRKLVGIEQTYIEENLTQIAERYGLPFARPDAALMKNLRSP